ncbi:MAG: DUF2589 domain-containing protein [Treponema sp.]|nr:DUF2589 domain-containing protein [Treponema sp.]
MKLSEFLIELRRAVNEASVSLAKKSIELFDEYFERQNEAEPESARIPKTVRMNYPVMLEDDTVQMRTVDVPLISLVPLNSSKIGKATFSIDFQLDDENGEVTVSFPKKRFGEIQHLSHLEISIVPDEVPQGVSSVVENYNDVIERQIEG